VNRSELIDILAADCRPVRPRGFGLAGGSVAAFATALALTWATVDLRSAGALASLPVLGKLLFTFSFAALTVPALQAALRPAAELGRRRFLPLGVVAIVAAAAILQATLQPTLPAWRADTPYCLVLIPLFGLPGLLLLVEAAKAQAPTDLRAAGFLVGLLAGGISATAYALHCPNDDPLYLVASYLPAILITGLLGRMLGPRILAW
jgi:hypothetical protein